VTVLRRGAELTLDAISTASAGRKAVGQIGVRMPDFGTQQRYGVVEALPRAVEKTWEVITFTVSIVAHMVMGEVSLKNMSGPLSIADLAGSAAAAGLVYFLSVLAAVSISLGILNLLPIPLLDGGQIVYQLAEWIKGAPLSERAMLLGQQIGIFFVIALTGFAFYNDIVRMLGS
jgi:regulator of sigma E protease